MLKTGTKAPGFTLQNQNGEMKSLSDYRGQKVILHFYPKDMTAGCTKQVCAFGEMYPRFREKGAEEVLEAYDVWKEKKNYGNVTMGVVRTTYLIDENGIIVKAFDKVKAADNPLQMLGELG